MTGKDGGKARPTNEVAEARATLRRYRSLVAAMASDPREWWTGEEVDHFLSVWFDLGLPAVVLQDATGERLTLWTVDLRRVAAATGLQIIGGAEGGGGIEIVSGEYVVCIVQADKVKETKDA